MYFFNKNKIGINYDRFAFIFLRQKDCCTGMPFSISLEKAKIHILGLLYTSNSKYRKTLENAWVSVPSCIS